MMMKCQFHWWRRSEYPEETTDLHQVTNETVTPTAYAQSQYQTRAPVVWSQVS